MAQLRRNPLSWLAALAVASACTPSISTPSLESMEPAWGYRGEETEVQLFGSAFFPRVSATAADEVRAVDDFRIFVETIPPTPLQDVVRLGGDTLYGVVPAGIEAGRYDVRVVGTSGEADTLASAFTVTDTRGATVALGAPAVRFDVGQEARIGLQLRDLSGNDVAEAIRVKVQAVAASGDASSVVFRQGLDGQEAAGVAAVSGSLDSGGGAEVYFTSTSVDDVALRVIGLDLNTHIDVTSPELRFEPASIDKVDITLEPGPYEVGVPVAASLRLLDADGNQTRGERLVATVQETCALGGDGYREVVTIADQLTIPDVVFMGATVEGACAENRLQVVGVVGGEAIIAQTDPLDVHPGDLARYRVTPVVDAVVAGTEPQTLVVVAEDDWGNPIVDHASDLSLSDNLGGLQPESGVGSASCSGFTAGQATCSALLEAAGETVAVEVSDASGVSGISRAFEVIAAPPVALGIETSSGLLEAGESFLVKTQAVDRFGNPSSIDGLGGLSALLLSDSTGSLACSGRFEGPAPGLAYSVCAIYTASAAVKVEVGIADTELSASASPIEVTNAALGRIMFDLSRAEVSAGAPLDFTLSAYDAFGNPYRVQAASNVMVTDIEGELSGASVLLDATGVGTGTVSLTRASSANRLQGRMFGTLYGESGGFAVLPGEHAGFDVEVGEPWVEVLVEREVRVQAVDAYGNSLDNVDTTISLSSLAGAAEGQQGLSMVSGSLTTTLTWDEAVLEDQVVAEDGTFSSAGGPIDSVDFDCPSPPSAGLTLAGETDLRLCLVSGQTNTITMSAASSQDGGAPIAAYHFGLGAESYSRQLQSSVLQDWSDEGAQVVEVLVVDEDACADRARARVWIGESDGQPVGPVDITVADATRIAGSTSSGTTTVELAAWDCAGDPASSGSLFVRATLGVVSSATSTLSATGQGLATLLDSEGTASLGWSFVGDDLGGEAVFHAGTTTGAAHGSASIAVNGDARPPRVVDYTPVGATDEAWSTVILGFDEALYSGSVTTSAFSITQPDGSPAAVDTVDLSMDRWVTITPTEPMDGGAGVWTLSVDSSLRDDGGGNYLSGDWTGSRSDFTLSFGDLVDSAPAVTSCVLDTAEFRPDGDDDSGVNADGVVVQVSADVVPNFWWVEVSSRSGTVVQWIPVAASSAVEDIRWDGRGADGLVVEAGRYTISARSLDSMRARSTACVAEVDVDHLVRAPELP